jgi:hypothetical protein
LASSNATLAPAAIQRHRSWTEVPRGLISYGRRHRSPSCHAQAAVVQAHPASGRQQEEDTKAAAASSSNNSHRAKVDVAAAGAKGVAVKPYPAIERQHIRFICDQGGTLLVGSSACPLRRGRPNLAEEPYESQCVYILNTSSLHSCFSSIIRLATYEHVPISYASGYLALHLGRIPVMMQVFQNKLW